MKKSVLLFGLVGALAVLTFVAGCKQGGPSTDIYVKKAMGQRIRVAVLPFDNVSSNQDAGRIITNTVITYLLSTGDYDVVEPGVVYSAMASEGIRPNEGITTAICNKLEPKLHADAIIVGLVEEYGEVRVGPDTYPSITFSARLVDAKSAEILWAATISKTGDENVKLFDIGRISSLGRLSNLAVKAMADSLAKSRSIIWSPQAGSQSPAPSQIMKVNNADTSGTHGMISEQSATETQPKQTALYLDEKPTYGEKELTAMLQDVGTAKLGPVTYQKHFDDMLDAQYQLGDTGQFAELKFVDYRKATIAQKFIQLAHQGDQATTFDTLPAFTSESDFGYYHLDIAVGRFGVYLRGPKTRKADIDALATGLIKSLGGPSNTDTTASAG